MNLRSAHKLSYREYQYFPNDGRRHEIIDGDHFLSPAPSTKHQTVSRHLQFQRYSQLELAGRGKLFNAPTDVELTVHDIVQPDQRAGVPEYWVVDPDEQSIEIHLLQDQRGYSRRTVRQGPLSLNVMPDVQVDIKKIWRS